MFNEYTYNGVFVRAHLYKLTADEKAWTFGIPREVLSADKVPMPDNEREERDELDMDTNN